MSLSALGVCLALATQPAAPPVFVPAQRFTLAWTHSIEKVRWEEDYEVAAPVDAAVAPALLAVAARVRGSGAGMEPAPGAVLRNGWYEFVPARRVHAELALTRSAYAADYEFCVDGGCRPLSALLPSDGGVTRLFACRAPR